MSARADGCGHRRYTYRPVTEPVGYRWPEGRVLAVYVQLPNFRKSTVPQILK